LSQFGDLLFIRSQIVLRDIALCAYCFRR